MKIRIFSFLILCLIVTSYTFSQTAWNVPADKKGLVNPLKQDVATIEKGKDIYIKNCRMCHGDPGLNNGQKLTPPPIDPASEKYQNQTDGELFFKINAGKGTMPSFEKVISENERWSIIAFVRTFNPNYKPKETVKVKEVKIALKLIDSSKIAMVTVTGKNEKNEEIAVSGAEVGFFVKRYFGNLQLTDKKVYTNAAGIALLAFPKDIPGDSTGNVQFSAKLMNELAYGNIEEKQILKWGVPTIPKNILSERAMWGNRANAPFWIVFLYLSVVLTVWGFLFYIFGQIMKLRNAGKKK